MMRSLFSGVSGLKTHQTKMDVIGNNIANVNTVGYKSQSITFQELLYQTTQQASGPNAEAGTGGTNAKQIGLGVTTGAINTNIETAGASQTTGNPFDIRITGDSFFIVNDGVTNYFTKAGAFYVDAAGNLAMTTTGYNVMGWQPDPTDPTVIKQDTVSALKILSSENLTVPPTATTKATASGIIDKNNTSLNSAAGAVYNLNFYDNLGYKYTAKFSIKPEDTALGKYKISLNDVLDTKGKSIVPEGTDISEMVGFGTNGTADLQYDAEKGDFISVNGADTCTLDFNENFVMPNGATLNNFQNIEVDFTGTNTYDNNGTSTFGMASGDAKGNDAGKQMGNMIGVSVLTNGMIYGTYSNGDKKLLGQIAVASFTNASGLSKEGNNLYSETLNSGKFDGIGADVTSDSGSMSTGVLEMSNVDLSLEFTEMITTQRGFQASSRIITTSDSLLEELVNLKR